MNKIFLLSFFALIILLLGIIVGFRSNKSNVSDQRTESSTAGNVTVTMTPQGFSPIEVVIKRGQTVAWVNGDSDSHWPASDVHPLHTIYPNSGLAKCGEKNQEGNFDACQNIAPGASWSFTFQEVGVWYYHDHLSPAFVGKVEVQ